MDKRTAAQAEAFEKGIPTARVVRIADAGHYVHGTNEAEVLKEIHQFVGGLKR
jgi:pimeloyl-ACP methyl ester carboxylesterase